MKMFFITKLNFIQRNDLKEQGLPGITVCYAFDLLDQYNHDIGQTKKEKAMRVKMKEVIQI